MVTQRGPAHLIKHLEVLPEIRNQVLYFFNIWTRCFDKYPLQQFCLSTVLEHPKYRLIGDRFDNCWNQSVGLKSYVQVLLPRRLK